LLIALLVGTAFAQKATPWTTWSKKDAEKMLNDSAWGRTQEDTDASSLVYSPTANDTTRSSTRATTDDKGVAAGPKSESGATNQAISVKFHIRFFSAKPVREAFARTIVLTQNKDEATSKAIAAKLQAGFVDLDYGDYVVVAVATEGTDRRKLAPADAALQTETAGTLKNTCYLERKDGKRVYLIDYEVPTPDQTGAKFIFPRSLDGQPFVTAESDMVRFVAEVGDKIKLNMKFKVPDMVFEGKLEY
jgi:hypothetical protein